jgi:hypothetical protein
MQLENHRRDFQTLEEKVYPANFRVPSFGKLLLSLIQSLEKH